MTKRKFIKQLAELDPFTNQATPSLDILLVHFEFVVREFERLEDLEDKTIQLQAYIDCLKEKLGETNE